MPGEVENETTLWKSLVCSAIETSGGLSGSDTVGRDQFSGGAPKHTGQAVSC